MNKEKCITKEKYEELYKIDEEIEAKEDLSLGDDLETFVTNVQHGEITKKTISDENWNSFFLIRLLDTKDRKKLDQKDQEFMETFEYNIVGKADVPKEEWDLSESNLKFSQSFCSRLTLFIEASENS